MDRVAWWATYSPWVTKSRSDFHFSLQLSQVRIFSFQSQAFFLALLILHLLGKFSCWCDWEEVIRLGKYKVLTAPVLQKEVSLKCSHMWFGLRIINTPTAYMSAGSEICMLFACPRWTSMMSYNCYLIMCGYVLSHFSRDWLFATLRTVAHQAPLSMGFSRQEY